MDDHTRTNARLRTASEENAAAAGLSLAYSAVRAYVGTAKCTYVPQKYLDKACFDLYPTRLSIVQSQSVLESLLESLFGSDWCFERVEWTYRHEVLIDAIWLVRNARGDHGST